MSQSDPRIQPWEVEVGYFRQYDNTKTYYAFHKAKGCPRNAVIERFDGHLRCSCCFSPLTDTAAVRLSGAREDERGRFILP